MPQAKPLVPYDVYYWKHFFRIAHAVIDIESSLLIKKILIIGIATFSRKVFYDHKSVDDHTIAKSYSDPEGIKKETKTV